MSRTLRAVLVLSCVFWAAPLQAEPVDRVTTTLGARFAALMHPEVGDGVTLPPLGLAVGRAHIVPAPGTTARLLMAEGTPCGVLLDGPATLTYRVEDPLSIPVVRRNLERVGGLRASVTGGTLTITGGLRGAAVWGFGLELAPLGTAEARTSRPPDWLEEILRRQLGSNPGRDMLLGEANGTPGYRLAVLRGTSDDFLLDVDPRPFVHLETFSKLLAIERAVGPVGGRLSAQSVVDQPIGRPWWEPRGVEFLSYDTALDVKNPRAEDLLVRATSRIQASRDGLRLLPFSLIAEQPAERNQDSAGPYALTHVRVDGADAPYVRHSSTLLVELPRPLRKGESVTLDVGLEGRLLVRPSGDRSWQLGAEPWYPRPESTGVEWASFKVTVEAAAPFEPIAAGDVVSREKTAAGTRVVTQLKGPMQAPTVVAGAYATRSETIGTSRIHVSAYGADKPSEARILTTLVMGVRGCLEEWLGVPYPFQDLQIIEMRDWGWGQAPPGVIFITQDAFMSQARGAALDDGTRTTAARASRGVNERVAHEVAHAWFPHVAKIVRAEDNWLSESFADYTSAVCLQRATADKGRAQHLFNRQLAEWKLRTADVGDGGSVFLANHVASGTREYSARADLLYGKGPLVLHALRQELGRRAGKAEEGDRLFMTWVRAIVRNFTFKVVDTRDLVAILNQITKAEWQPWFEKYVYGTEVPAVK